MFDLNAEIEIRRACEELDRRLRRGEPACAEDFLVRRDDWSGAEDAALELIYTEYVAREELGQNPTAVAFLERFPQWREGLREQLEIHALLMREAPPSVPAVVDPDREDTLPWTPRAATGGELVVRQEQGGQRIGPYELLEEIARGASGVVYKAWHHPLRRLVALKMVLAGAFASRQQFARFYQEAEIVASLQHSNIVQIHEVGEFEGRPFLALEYVGGGNLAQKLGGSPLPPADAAALMERLARAMDYAHRVNVLHRDLKPPNILLTTDGVPKITDFGLAKFLDRQGGQTQSDTVFGTPSYMAPEQAAGRLEDVDARTDVYSLGAILYEALTGRPPFRAENLLHTLHQVVSVEPVPPERLQPGVPRDLAVICTKCLQKDRTRRYPTAGALSDDLGRFLRGEPVLARPAGAGERVWKWARRRPAMAALIGVVAVALCTIFAGGLWYNAQLRQAAAEAQRRGEETAEAARAVEAQKLEAQRQGVLLQRQLDSTRRAVYALELSQAAEVLKSNPARARELLEDPQLCPPDLRDFTWGMYDHLARQNRFIPTGHTQGIPAVAFSADGRTVATAGDDDTAIKLWDAATGQPRGDLHDKPGGSQCLAFSPDRQLLASGGRDGSVRVWDLANRGPPRQLRGHDGAVLCLAFSADGAILASGSSDHTVRLWNLAAPQPQAVLRGHSGAVTCLAFVRDANTLISGGDDQTVRFWDIAAAAAEKERKPLHLESVGAICGLAVSPDGARLAVVGNQHPDCAVFLLGTLQQETLLRGHLDRIFAVAFSPDGKWLATGSEDRTVRLWEVDKWTPLATLQGHENVVRTLAFSPSGRLLASAGNDNRLSLWAVQCLVRLQGHEEERSDDWRSRIVSLAISPNGKLVAAGSHDGTILLRDGDLGIDLGTLAGHSNIIWSLAFSPDGKLLASAAEDGKVRLWDPASRAEKGALLGHEGRVWGVAFAAQGQLLATAGEDGTVRLWDAVSRTQRRALRTPGPAAVSVGFSPDGQTLAAGLQDGRVVLWDAGSGAMLAKLQQHTKAVLVTLFSPDGKTLATGGIDNSVVLWDRETLQPRATLPCQGGYVFSASFTPDSRTLATGTGSRVGSHFPGEVRLWDVATGHCRALLSGQSGPLAFCQSGARLATVCHYTAIMLWERSPDPL